MKKKDYLELVFDYTHNARSCELHKGNTFPDILSEITEMKSEGFYEKKDEKIEDVLSSDIKTDILQILARGKELNAMQLKKILGYSYPTISRNLKALEKLRLIQSIRGKSENGKMDYKYSISNNVKILPLSPNMNKIIDLVKEQMEYSKKGLSQLDEWIDNKIKAVNNEPTIRTSEKNKKRRLHH